MGSIRIQADIPGFRPYDILVARGGLDGLGGELSRVPAFAQRGGLVHAVVVADEHTAPLYAVRVQTSLQAAGIRSELIRVPAGEECKGLEVVCELWRAFASLGLDRGGAVVALGGGAAGDIAGFAAATYLRGVPFVQVPTTLLSMVDASLGGKSAANLPQGKNLVGAVAQPAFVLADPELLATLPERELRSGFAEAAKTALLSSDDAYFALEELAHAHAGAPVPGAPASAHALVADPAFDALLARLAATKLSFVAEDPFDETGVRAALNLGHTFGHALERAAGFGTYTHGECVAEGMRFAARIAEAHAGAAPELTEAQDALLDALGLPALRVQATPEELLAAMAYDKKARNAELRFVLLADLGRAELQPIPDGLLLEYLDCWLAGR